jgi:hypothetical protein
MTIENKLVPKGAMQLLDKGCHATAFSVTDDGGKELTQMEMTVYSGGVIKNHWYWDDLVMDLEGLKLSKSKYPVLEDHSTERKIAFSGKPIVKDGKLMLEKDNTIFVDTEVSHEFQKLSKQGFPFQSSLRGVPKRVERIEEGTETQVNGFSLKGPGTVWREWDYMEGSVCVFGWDDNTSAAAFSKEEIALNYELTLSKKDKPSKEEPKIMDLDQFKKDHPELFAEIVKTATDQAIASFTNEKTALTGTIEALNTKLSQSDEEIKKLAKRDAIRAEKEIFAEAEVIWTKKLVASDIPERMFEKVKKNVDHNAFVKDDVLDKDAFSAAIDTELKDWEDFKNVKDLQIQGTGFSAKDVDKKTATDAENAKIADGLFAMTGQAKK